MAVKRNNPASPPADEGGLSVLGWATVALVALLIAIGLLGFYAYQVPRLVESGVQNQIFYLLLIPWALSSAAFLFGAMKSYARYTYKRIGSVLELGGPVVLFCLVIIGGFKLVPAASEAFDLTIRAHSTDNSAPIVTSGKITLDLDNDRRSAPFDSNGEANFKGIPPKFLGTTIKMLPQVDGFAQQWVRHKVRGNVLEIALEPVAEPRTILKGTVVPVPKRGDLKVVVDGQSGQAIVDQFGRFEIPVVGKDGARVRLRAFSAGHMVFDDYRTLPGPVTLPVESRN
jgi:hypothetical protein